MQDKGKATEAATEDRGERGQQKREQRREGRRRRRRGNRGKANRGQGQRESDRDTETDRDPDRTKRGQTTERQGKARAREGTRPGATRALLHGGVSSPKLSITWQDDQHKNAQENVSQSRVHRDNKTTHAPEAQGNKKGLN